MAYLSHTNDRAAFNNVSNSYRAADHMTNLYGTYPRRPLLQNGASSVGDKYPTTIAIQRTTPRPTHTHSNGVPSPLATNSQSLKSILRNRLDYVPVNVDFDEAVAATVLDISQESSRSDSSSSSGKSARRCPSARRLCRSSNAYVRPGFSEFLSELFVVFAVTFVEAMIAKGGGLSRFGQIAILSLVEGALFIVMASTFYKCKIQLNPVLTLGALFAGGISPFLAAIYWIAQCLGACLGVFCYQVAAVNSPIIIPSFVGAGQTSDSAWFTGMYQIVVCQTFSSAMIVLCYAMTCIDSQSGVVGKHLSVACAVSLSSLLSLLVSTASWNPVRTFAACLVSSLVGGVNVQSWKHHYVFWLGSIIGSLFASFFYRLIFADKSKRLTCCRGKRTQIV